MPRLFDFIMRRFGSKTIRLRAACLRHPTKSPAEIREFLDELLPQVETGRLTNEEFTAKEQAFYGRNPTLIFIGYVALNPDTKQLQLINLETGEWLGLPLAGDIVVPIREFQQMYKVGDLQRVS